MRHSTGNLAQRRFVRRGAKSDAVGRQMRRQRQVGIERRVAMLQRHRTNQSDVITEGIRELTGEVESAGALASDVHHVGPALGHQQSDKRLGQVADVGW
jgi:hypothetical protein